MTCDELSRCLELCRRYWPHAATTWTADILETWESLLLDLDAAAVAAAIQILAVEGREWPPPPGVVRQRTCDLTSPRPSADEAWGEIRAQVRKVGSLRGKTDLTTGQPVEPCWSHPLVGAVADRIGWDALCQSTNEVADRAHFLRIWETASTSERTMAALPPAARAALESHGIALPDLRAKELGS